MVGKVIALLLAPWLLGCAAPNQAPISSGASGISKLRADALRESALRAGTQHGYRRRAHAIMRLLDARQDNLSTAFNFAPLVGRRGAGYVVPPVTARALNAVEATSNGQEMASAAEYRAIIVPARLAAAIPNWRDYLHLESGESEPPPKSLQPHGVQERAAYRRWLAHGKAEGARQADAEFNTRLTRLRRDYEGMRRWRRLEAIGAATPTRIETRPLAPTRAGNELRLGAQQTRILRPGTLRAVPRQP